MANRVRLPVHVLSCAVMGIYVRLEVNPLRITANQWEAFYQESLMLLRRFPAPLMRLMARETPAGSRLVWSGSIVEREGTPDENWVVGGDLETNLRAETFCLHRVFERQFQWRRLKLEDKDVLWRLELDEDGQSNGEEVFGNKTQGFPYHLAILAVAILAESRFPGRACAGGDIDREVAEEVVRWAGSILAVPVSLPVCFDLDRLHARLETLYPDSASIHGRIEELYRGPEADLMDALARRSGEAAVLARMKEELAGYKTLGQIGATALVGRLLRLTGDPARLIEFIEEVNAARAAKAQFPLEELFRLTYARFSGPVAPRADPARIRRMKTQDDVWADIGRKLTGQDDSGWFIAPARLLEAFAARAPSRRADFERIMVSVS